MVGLISTTGFPIAACIYLLYRDTQRDQRNDHALAENMKDITDNMKEFSKTLHEIAGFIQMSKK